MEKYENDQTTKNKNPNLTPPPGEELSQEEFLMIALRLRWVIVLSTLLFLIAGFLYLSTATPHQLGRFNGCNEAAEIREKVRALNEELRSSHIALNIIGGAEVRVDERICQLLNDDKILTLANGGRHYVLLLTNWTLQKAHRL